MTSKERTKDKYLQRKYGITLKTYYTMLRDQKESCAICERHRDNFKNALHVDHNHKTKKVRALLCFTCNRRRVGQLNLVWAEKVYKYLLKYDIA